MYEEKRKGEKAIPDNLDDYLTDYQQAILKNINKFGWKLQFIRRPSGDKPTAVIGDKEGIKFGVLEQGGAINFETGTLFREQNESVESNLKQRPSGYQ